LNTSSKAISSSLALALAFGVAGCTSSLARTAEHGDNQKLAAQIAERHQVGHLSDGAARDIARAVVARELGKAKDATLLHYVRAAEGSARHLTSELQTLAKNEDEPGALAALYLIEQGDYSRAKAWRYRRDPRDYFRQLYPLSLTNATEEESALRVEALLDPSPLVRRSAAAAAVKAEDPLDEQALWDAVAKDPDDAVRGHALKALTLISMNDPTQYVSIPVPSKHTPSRLSKFTDAWKYLPPSMRNLVATAWLTAPLFEAGGRSEALRVLRAETTEASLALAAQAKGSHPQDLELVQTAHAQIGRHLVPSPVHQRKEAIALAPLPEFEKEIELARKDSDAAVRIAAEVRLLQTAKKSEAMKALVEMGRVDSETGRKARMALAQIGERNVQAWLEHDLEASTPVARLEAARGLTLIGRTARIAPMLARGTPEHQMQFAYLMLSAEH
jgi:hypothetical protein